MKKKWAILLYQYKYILYMYKWIPLQYNPWYLKQSPEAPNISEEAVESSLKDKSHV